MKQFFLLATLLASGVLAQAQVPFLEYGKEWVYDRQPEAGYSFRDRYYIDGDTVVADRECMRLFAERKQNYNGDQRVQKGYEGALYEDGCKVYYIQRGKQEPVLIYDFGLEVGDKANVAGFREKEGGTNIEIVKTDSINLEGSWLKILQYKSDFYPSGYGGWWIEGVGDYRTLTPNNDWFFYAIDEVAIGGGLAKVMPVLREKVYSERIPYRPMVVEGRRWRYEFITYSDVDSSIESTSTMDYVIDGDTLIGNDEYKKMYKEEDNGKRTYISAWSEKNRMVAVVDAGATSPNVLYDFGLIPSEMSVDPELSFLSHVDTISVDGNLFLRHNLRTLYQGGTITYVEGVGCPKLLWPYSTVVPTNARTSRRFVGVFEGDKCIFKPEDFSREGYTSGIGRVSSNPRAVKHDDAIYNIQGNKVTKSQGNRLPKGIYIQNGKKFVVK